VTSGGLGGSEGGSPRGEGELRGEAVLGSGGCDSTGPTGVESGGRGGGKGRGMGLVYDGGGDEKGDGRSEDRMSAHSERLGWVCEQETGGRR